jgi:hypothetical protein
MKEVWLCDRCSKETPFEELHENKGICDTCFELEQDV